MDLTKRAGIDPSDNRVFSQTIRESTFVIFDVTLADSSHIDLRISDYRRELADKRGLSKAGSSDRMFETIRIAFDHVVETIREDMDPFGLEAIPNWNNTSLARRRERDLRAISLVHRSLTASAQFALRRRVVIYGREDLRSFLCSPLCGPWVRELVLHWNLDSRDFAHQDGRQEVLTDMMRLLAALLSRASNIRSLCLRTGYGELWKYSAIVPFLNSLAGLSSLRNLWLVHFGVGDMTPTKHMDACCGPHYCPLLRELYSVLPSLLHLQALSIRNWGFGKDSHSFATRLVRPPLPSPLLQSIEFEPAWNLPPAPSPLWLFEQVRSSDDLLGQGQPRHSQEIFVSTRPYGKIDPQRYLSAFGVFMVDLRMLAMKSIASLHFSALYEPQTMRNGPRRLSFVPISHASDSLEPTLRRVHLITRAQIPVVQFPSSLDELHLHFHFKSVAKRARVDTKAHALIANGSLRKLKLLRITVSSDRGPVKIFRDGSSIDSVRLELVEDFCEEEGVKLLCYAEELPVWARR